MLNLPQYLIPTNGLGKFTNQRRGYRKWLKANGLLGEYKLFEKNIYNADLNRSKAILIKSLLNCTDDLGKLGLLRLFASSYGTDAISFIRFRDYLDLNKIPVHITFEEYNFLLEYVNKPEEAEKLLQDCLDIINIPHQSIIKTQMESKHRKQLKLSQIRTYSTLETGLSSKALYTFVGRDWSDIKDKCKGMSGIYAFVNNNNGNYYIGSAVCLYSRLRDYHQKWYLEDKRHLPIVRALLKYGMNNFTILILELSTKENIIKREQEWLDNFKPVYNILKIAGNSSGYTHAEVSKQKISDGLEGKTRTEEQRKVISENQIGSANTFYGKTHTEEAKLLIREAALKRIKDPKPGFKVEVTDTLTDISTSYKSLRSAAKYLGTTHGHLLKFNGKLFKDRYFIMVNNNKSE